MTPSTLEPSLDLLRQEFVLVQAWKKTASYIRYHNWFSDTLRLDRTAINLPRFREVERLLSLVSDGDAEIIANLRRADPPPAQCAERSFRREQYVGFTRFPGLVVGTDLSTTVPI